MTTLTTQLEALEKGGFSSEEINIWKQDKVLTLENAGFESDEILAEFGYEPIDKGPIKKNMGKHYNFRKRRKTNYL